MKQKYFAQFFEQGPNLTLREPCGDRSVVILDGRMSNLNMHAAAYDEARKRGYIAYQLRWGTFTNSDGRSGIHHVTP